MVGIHDSIDLNGIGSAAVSAGRARTKVVGLAGLDFDINGVQVCSLASPSAHGFQAAWIDNGGLDLESVVPRLNPERIARHNLAAVDGHHGHGMDIVLLLPNHTKDSGRIRAGVDKGRSGCDRARRKTKAAAAPNLNNA